MFSYFYIHTIYYYIIYFNKLKMKILEKINIRRKVHFNDINKRSRKQGQLATIIAGSCTFILSNDLVKNPITITVITVIGGIAGIIAGHRLSKTI